uniref:Uncharacterized protein n=1 Tax=Aromatoleum toluolicum TaxID=90060 RepID=A0ABX1NDV7_9RHOO|nr:hypothetical protein [Aromatoleum toluolicum]
MLDALRGLGGSGSPDEVVERIASDLVLPDEIQNELLPTGELRYRNQVAWVFVIFGARWQAARTKASSSPQVRLRLRPVVKHHEMEFPRSN